MVMLPVNAFQIVQIFSMYPALLVFCGAVVVSGCESVEDPLPEFSLPQPSKLITDCAAYDQSILFRPRARQIVVSADQDWQQILEQAEENTEILLQNGVYHLTQHRVSLKDDITVRSASGNRDLVHIQGVGYQSRGEGLAVTGDRVTIADVSVGYMRDHAISIHRGSDGANLYNLHVYDTGTQHIKGNVGAMHDGVVACSSIGYSADGAVGDYNGGIDLHEAHNWHIAHNYLYNIAGDGSGCDVDIDCGRYISGPAILVWNGSSNVNIYDNTIVDSFRNIALGLGRGHDGGSITDNLIVQSVPGDAGIELQTASNVLVEGNAVVLAGTYPGAIEYRDSRNILIQHNQVSASPWDRGNNLAIGVYQNRVVGRDYLDGLAHEIVP